MKHSLLFIFLLSFTTSSYSQIYQCKDELGRTVFKDNDCDSPNNVIQLGAPVKRPVHSPTKQPKDDFGTETGKPGKLIYSNNKRLSSPYRMKVDEVRIITETEDTLIVDVIYTYRHKIPAEEIKIYITPNHAYWSTTSIQAEKGHHVGRATIGLSRSNMKKDYVTRSSTDTISIRFEHYAPKKYKGVIWSETVKYNKNWKLR